jgi:glycine dehydrogenase
MTATDVRPAESLADLSGRPPFARRHIGTSPAPDQRRMLDALGFSSVDALLDAAIPQTIRERTALAIPPAATEPEVADELRALADRNRVVKSMIGLGYYDTVTPAVIRRNVLENPAWYTAYTPYQPEISQGRLEALLNFQTPSRSPTRPCWTRRPLPPKQWPSPIVPLRRLVPAPRSSSSTPTPCPRPSK